jgi:putative hemolysin
MPPDAALLNGGLYSETEFDLTPLDELRPRMAELGRSCATEGWRNGGVILLLWSALADFRERRQLDPVVGCASVPMHDGGHLAARLWSRLQQTHLAVPERRVQPRLQLPVAQLEGTLNVATPALIKG